MPLKETDPGYSAGMRELQAADLGVLLSVFAVLLIFFGIDFRVSRGQALRHRGRALLFACISVLGEAATALALALCWVAMFLPPEAQGVDTVLVFVPGTLAIICAVILTGEVVSSRVAKLLRPRAAQAQD